ncbi:MAG: hypothetical protein Kow0059_01070 [Candidatus Sumerlaeia bacterium]
MSGIILAVSLVDIFLLSPVQPRAIDRLMAPPAVLNVAWRPSQEVVARGAFGEILEGDLLMFMHLRGEDEAALLRLGRFFSRQEAFAEPDPVESEWVRGQITDLITVYYLASHPTSTPQSGASAQKPAVPGSPSSPGDADMQALLERFLSYPAAELIWIDHDVIPKVKIDRADIIHYYRQFESEFKIKGTFEIQYAFIPAPVGQTEVQRREIVTYLERLKSNLAGADDWQAVLFQLQRRRPDILVEYRRETLKIGEEPDSTFEKNVLELKPGEFSSIFETIEGYYLVQCLKSEPPRRIALPQAEADIRQTLHQRFILNQYNIEVGRLQIKSRYQLYADRWEFLPPEAPVLAIGDFRLFRRDVERLLSNQMYLNKEVYTPALTLFVNGVLTREMILARCVQEKFWDDPRWEKGQSLARKLMAALHALADDYAAQTGEESPAQLRRFFDLNPELFSRKQTVRVVQIIGTLKNPDSYLPSDRSYLIENMKKRLDEFVRQADDLMLAPRQAFREAMSAGGETATTSTLALELFDPKRFEDILKDYNTREYQFRIRDAGYLDLTGLKPLGDVLEGVRPGHFSPTGTFENTAATYYVWDVGSTGEQTFEEMLPAVRQAFRRKYMEQIWTKRREEALYWGDVKWAF